MSVCRLPQWFGNPSHGARLLPMVSECPVVLLAPWQGTDRQTDRQGTAQYGLARSGRGARSGLRQCVPTGTWPRAGGPAPYGGTHRGARPQRRVPVPTSALSRRGDGDLAWPQQGARCHRGGQHRWHWVHRGLPAGTWHGEHRKAGSCPPSCRYPCPQPVTLLGDGQCQGGQGTGTLCPLPSAVRGRGLQQAARTSLGYSDFIFM